jgi:ABC-type transporter Mla MlaB component
MKEHPLLPTARTWLQAKKTVTWWDWDLTDPEQLDLAAMAWLTHLDSFNQHVARGQS